MSTENKQTKEESISNKKYQKEYWIYANIVLLYAPYVFALLIGLFIHNFDLKSLVINGELIITAFSLSSISILSLFNSEKRNNDPKCLRYFIICLVICCFELIVYSGIKIAPRSFIVMLVLSLVMNLASIIFSLAANFYLIDKKTVE